MIKKEIDIPIWRVMTAPVKTVVIETPLKKIGQIFRDNSFHHLPVVNPKGLAVGIISREDFSKMAHLLLGTVHELEKSKAKKMTARDIMMIYPISLEQQESLEKAIGIFLRNRVHAIIIQDKELQGILTTYDVMRYLYEGMVESKEREEQLIEEEEEWAAAWEDFFD